MTDSEDTPTFVVKLKMATGTATSASTTPKLKCRKPSRLPTLYDAIIYVNVGPTQERFGIHKSLLSHHSSYFKAALEGGFEESETGGINLIDEDPDVFWVFNEWLYSGTVPYQNYATHRGEWSALLDLYVFAEKRIIPKFQNALIDAMINVWLAKWTYPETEIHLAWVNTTPSSPLHGFLTALYTRSVSMDECFGQQSEKRKCFDVDFVMQVAIALDNDRDDDREGDRLWEDRCLWHIHGPEDPPCRDDSSLTGSK